MADVVSLRGHEARGPVAKETADGVLRLTLNAPPANALSVPVMEALVSALDAVARDGTVHAVIIGASGPVFSIGRDLEEMTRHRADADGGRAAFEAVLALSARLMTAIMALPQPVIAEIDGLATAAGCELVGACDLAICTDTATFCTPGVNIGLVPAGAMVALSRGASRKQAMEMLLTGETIDASTAKDFGLVNRIVPKPYLRQVVDKYAAVIASKSPEARRAVKSVFTRQAGLLPAEAYAAAVTAEADSLMSADAVEGIGAHLAHRMPAWTTD